MKARAFVIATMGITGIAGCGGLLDTGDRADGGGSGSSGGTGGGSSSGAHASPDSSSQNQSAPFVDLDLSLSGMQASVTHLFEYRIVDAHNVLQSRGVVGPLGAANVVLNVPRSIPAANGPCRLDLYVDVNDSGGYDGLGSVLSNDHAWRIDPLTDYPVGAVSHVDGLVRVTFAHNTSFIDINQYPLGAPNPPRDSGLDATVHVINAGALYGNLLQARVVESAANRTVGLFRMPQIPQGTFSMRIPGVVENGADYRVFIYADANGNRAYDNPAHGAGDLGWSIGGAANDTGLDVTLDVHGSASSNVDVGAP